MQRWLQDKPPFLALPKFAYYLENLELGPGAGAGLES